MILDLSSLKYIPSEQIKLLIFQLKFRSQWDSVHLERTIITPFYKYWITENNGFIVCYDTLKDSYMIFAFNENHLKEGLELIKLNVSHKINEKLHIYIAEYAKIAEEFVNKLGLSTETEIREFWGIKKVTKNIDWLQQISTEVEEANVSLVDKINALHIYHPHGNVDSVKYIEQILKHNPTAVVFNDNKENNNKNENDNYNNEKRVIGFMGMHSDGRIGFSYVAAEARNQKIGYKLYANLYLRGLKDHNFQETIHTIHQDNKISKKWTTSLGGEFVENVAWITGYKQISKL